MSKVHAHEAKNKTKTKKQNNKKQKKTHVEWHPVEKPAALYNNSLDKAEKQVSVTLYYLMLDTSNIIIAGFSSLLAFWRKV